MGLAQLAEGRPGPCWTCSVATSASLRHDSHDAALAGPPRWLTYFHLVRRRPTRSRTTAPSPACAPYGSAMLHAQLGTPCTGRLSPPPTPLTLRRGISDGVHRLPWHLLEAFAESPLATCNGSRNWVRGRLRRSTTGPNGGPRETGGPDAGNTAPAAERRQASCGRSRISQPIISDIIIAVGQPRCSIG